MGVSTIYDIGLEYRVRGNAASGLADIANQADRASRSTDAVGDAFKTIAGLAVGAFGLHEAKEAFIGFNAEMQSMQISAAAQLQSNDLARTFDEATESAKGFVTEFQRFAVTSPVTTKELFQFSNGVSTAVAQAGGQIKDIVNVTEQGVIAAKALGANSDYAAMEITEGIQRGATARQRFVKQLVATQHMTTEDFNKLTEGGRLKVIENALNSPAMKAAAKAFGGSFEGVTSTLKDTFQILAGEAGHGLFTAVTDEVKGWNEWLMKNKSVLEDIKSSVSKGLVDAFKAVKSAVSWIVDHGSEIKFIVEALLLLKGASLAGSAIQGGISAITSNLGALNAASLDSVAGLTSLASKAMTTVGALGALYLAAQAFASWVDSNHKANIEGPITSFKLVRDRIDHSGALFNPATSAQTAGQIVQMLRSFHAFNDDTMKVDESALRKAVSIMGFTGQQFTALAATAADIYARNHLFKADFGNGSRLFDPDAEARNKAEATKKPTPMNVTIQRIEVASDDPDRFVAGLSRAFDKARRTPGQARQALAGGL